jgi:hypothetical protein
MATKKGSASNQTLNKARDAKQDEFYTQLNDISNELRHYKEQFRGKVVFCNCDDPFESNFFKYFALNFNSLGLKKLIATSYAGSPIAGQALPLFDMEGLKQGGVTALDEDRRPHAIEINEVPDGNDDGAIDLTDVEVLLRSDANVTHVLIGDGDYGPGDFRSAQCVEFLKQADVVVTNPPFSLFREYVAMLVGHGKKFLIVGNKNAITYKEIFPLIMKDQLWMGTGFSAGNAYFKIPPENARSFASGVYDQGTGLVKFRNVGWFTNMDHKKRHEEIPLFRQYNRDQYPKYHNYPEAIEVSKVADIPVDYDGAMGVPITFLDKYNPNQFEILGSSRDLGVPMSSVAAKGSFLQGGPRFYLENPDGTYRRMYDRIVIRRK